MARFKSFRRYFSFVRNAGFREHRVASIKRAAHASHPPRDFLLTRYHNYIPSLDHFPFTLPPFSFYFPPLYRDLRIVAGNETHVAFRLSSAIERISSDFRRAFYAKLSLATGSEICVTHVRINSNRFEDNSETRTIESFDKLFLIDLVMLCHSFIIAMHLKFRAFEYTEDSSI